MPDGRRIGYDDHGPADGHPIFYFHGTPSSRLDFNVFGGDSLTQRIGVRVVAVDRPGCGLSDFQARRQISDWPADVVALADHLGLDRFAVLGWSGGGPYALVCASALGPRIHATAVVSGMSPFDVPSATDGINPSSLRFFRWNRDRPLLGVTLDWLMSLVAHHAPERFLAQTRAALPAVDRDAIALDQPATAYVDAVRECFHSGTRGARLDTALMAKPWGFDPRCIQTPVALWHGGCDADTPPAMGDWLAATVPHSQAYFLAEEGHISLIIKQAETILTSLIPDSADIALARAQNA